MSDRWLFLVDLCVQGIRQRVRYKIMYELAWITILYDSWGDTIMISTRDFATNENRYSNRLTRDKQSLFTLTHSLFYMSCIQWVDFLNNLIPKICFDRKRESIFCQKLVQKVQVRCVHSLNFIKPEMWYISVIVIAIVCCYPLLYQ